MFEALKQIFMEDNAFKEGVLVIVAGDGPWGAKYRTLGSNVLALGPLDQDQVARFYNAIDLFVNPTLRAQGLDHTLLEAMLSGKPLVATRLASITGTVMVSNEMGYTFSPTLASLKDVLRRIWKDGKGIVEMKGRVARERGLKLFTASKMAAAYEKLFLCISTMSKGDRDDDDDSLVYVLHQKVCRRVEKMSSVVFRSTCAAKDCSFKSAADNTRTWRFYVRNSVASPPQNLQLHDYRTQKLQNSVRIGVLGASGYTGSEIVRLLANHPYFSISLMTADRKAGQSIASVFPHLITQQLPDLVAVKDADFSTVDAVFCCLPHGTTQDIIKGLPRGLRIVDLSADFRLRDIAEYEEWYGQPHRAPDLQKEAVYGLTEIMRKNIQNAQLVANPGCYPTSIQLPLVPLIKANLIELRNIIIDSKSGVSGAGRAAKEANLYTEIAEGIHSYGITRHRHVPEIEQGLSEAAQSKVTISFTPHLMPMSRGMQSTIYVEMAPGATVDDLYQQLKSSYEAEEFIILLDKGVVPHTQNVRGSNYCVMNVFADRIPGRAIIVSVIDNLVKGASGQAIQNLNSMMGFPENTGLLYQPLFP
ncbi:hypothetical protein Nepgr_000131 [Nepenthes gracilis]|uniref:Probable N-acetyl-gamma-glutamyl-phosphate reductase, chloroplastic n=1 Tax=Nepenthes gracilis TaxID=150966 RepID=A0AAD3RVB2_NEPGR|nr:hypothetical protein Nepgr_000131 [Nepenthes gracilis]